MIIIGAGGHAKEVLDIVSRTKDNISFFDDYSSEFSNIYNDFNIIRDTKELTNFFKTNPLFCLGVGNPRLRKDLFDMCINLNGIPVKLISEYARIGKYASIGDGSVIMDYAIVSSGASVGKGSLLYNHSQVTHDAKIGDFCEVSPGATILGNSTVGQFSSLGANSTILPNVAIGSNCIIGAGALVTKHIPSNSTAVGVPAKIIKTL